MTENGQMMSTIIVTCVMLCATIGVAVSIRQAARTITDTMLLLERRRQLSSLSSVWNGGEVMTSRLAVAAMFKEFPYETVDLKQALTDAGRRQEWRHVATVAQFLRRASNAFELGLVERGEAALEFQGLVWWATRIATTYQRFPEEVVLAEKLFRFRDGLAAAGP